MIQHITTPFGRRTLTPAQIQAQANAAACPDGVTVHKWSVFRNVAAARRRLRLTDRAVAVLDALLTFHPEIVLSVCPETFRRGNRDFWDASKARSPRGKRKVGIYAVSKT